MNIRGIANAAISVINSNTAATLKQSAGYTTSASGKRTPTYTSTPVVVQVQALSSPQIAHLDGLNIQGVLRNARLDGDWRGAYRPGDQGGDLFVFGTTEDVRADLRGTTWLVVQVMETWATWCSLAIQLQKDSTP
ncbi:hypothetical protein AX768_09180 [Burkholderia sp. PAMC 28687]|uniref:hypothetical protein n=1 Tax=Burkholderia sp. PAMC 28687 TaxID=1795874 RepID=UPI000785FBE1|nr:hypothetical protein [Burkholderia sp. PAMC 28687]AMM14241.1 hypothetical protein AX768_09180 [Burkholderia sp. PAMC 28687]